MITELKTEICNKAWSFQPKSVQPIAMQSACFDVENLSLMINSELAFGDALLSKKQEKACDVVAQRILESLNKSLPIEQQ